MGDIRVSKYTAFRGVDYASGQTQVSPQRSPYAINMMPDGDGHPEKRPGWRVIADFPDNPVLGVYQFRRTSGEIETLLHRKHDLCLYDDKTMQVRSVLYDGLSGSESFGFQMSGKFWLMTCGDYIYYDGFKTGNVSDIADVPLIMAGRKPSGGGVMIDNINLLTPKRRVSFLGDGSAKTYQLPSTEIEEVIEVSVNNRAMPADSYSVDIAIGTVTFNVAPTAPQVTGEDNVEITYSKITRDTEEVNIAAGELEQGTGVVVPKTEIYGVNIYAIYPTLARPVKLYVGQSYASFAFRWKENGRYVYRNAYGSPYSYDNATGRLIFNTPEPFPVESGDFELCMHYIENNTRYGSYYSYNDLKAMGAIIGASTTVSRLDMSVGRFAGLDICNVIDVLIDNQSHAVGDVKNIAADETWGYDPATRVLSFSNEMTASDRYLIKYETSADGNLSRVLGCRFGVLYGYGSSDRMFISGNPKYPNYDYWSEMDNPAYIGDLNYSIVGAESSEIRGYAKLGSSLMILKEDSPSDFSVYVRTASIDDSGVIYFPQRQSVASLGLLGRNAVAGIGDEPMYLSRNGIVGIYTNGITTEKMVQNRSYYIDNILKKESNPENACAIEWSNRFMIAFPDSGNCYILDGNQGRVASVLDDNSYIFECYHWNNIFAKRFFVIGTALMFIDADGRLCRFNTDISTGARWSDAGQAIECCWSTLMDDDGDFMVLKTLMKRGVGVLVKPYNKSTVEFCVRTEQHPEPIIKAVGLTGVLDWGELEFSPFTFNASDVSQVVTVRTKVKKYTMLQIVCRNRTVNEGFGIEGIEKTFVVVGYRK